MIYRKESKFSGTYLYVKKDEEDDYEIKEDITGLISIYDRYKEKGMRVNQVKGLLLSLTKEGLKLENDNKSIEGLILDPRYVYIKQDAANEDNTEDYKFIYYAYTENDVKEATLTEFHKSYIGLMEFILWHINYEDEEAIKFAYDSYMKIYRGDFRVS